MWRSIERFVLWLAVFSLAYVVTQAQFSSPPARWNAALRCTEVSVFGTTAKAYICSGTMQPPECSTDPADVGPGLCYRSSTGQFVRRDTSGSFSF